MKTQDPSQLFSNDIGFYAQTTTLTHINDQPKFEVSFPRRAKAESLQAEHYGETLESFSKNILVLGLDETLIYSNLRSFNADCLKVKVTQPSKSVTYYVMPRPGLLSFIQTIHKCFKLFLYTCNDKEYAEAILGSLSIREYFDGIFDKKFCVQDTKRGTIKDLNRLDLPMRQSILIDVNDKTANMVRNPDNGLRLQPFLGDPNDNCLSLLLPFLKYVSEDLDVRPVSIKQTEFAKNNKSLDDVEDKKGSFVNYFPVDSPKKLMTSVNTPKHLRTRSHFVSVREPTHKRRGSWKLFQETLTPLSIEKKERKSVFVFSDKKSSDKSTRNLSPSSFGIIDEGKNDYIHGLKIFEHQSNFK